MYQMPPFRSRIAPVRYLETDLYKQAELLRLFDFVMKFQAVL